MWPKCKQCGRDDRVMEFYEMVFGGICLSCKMGNLMGINGIGYRRGAFWLGQEVQVSRAGGWLPGTIIGIQDGRYSIKVRGHFFVAFLTSVPPVLVRAIERRN